MFVAHHGSTTEKERLMVTHKKTQLRHNLSANIFILSLIITCITHTRNFFFILTLNA